jgi:hypothetical protein
VVDASIQVEMDTDMTVRCLALHEQGLLSSYIPMPNSKVQNWGFSSRDTTYTESLISSLLEEKNSRRDLQSLQEQQYQLAAIESKDVPGFGGSMEPTMS